MSEIMREVILVPFSQPPLELSLKATIKYDFRFIDLEFEVYGQIEQILFPKLSSRSERKDGLWEHTCFEAFFQIQGKPSYWELNISPSGDWNFYHFDNYRQNLKSEGSLKKVELTQRESSGGSRRYSVRLDLGTVIPDLFKKHIKVGITAVVETVDGTKSYWALAHLGSRPDFHLNQSFQIGLLE